MRHFQTCLHKDSTGAGDKKALTADRGVARCTKMLVCAEGDCLTAMRTDSAPRNLFTIAPLETCMGLLSKTIRNYLGDATSLQGTRAHACFIFSLLWFFETAHLTSRGIEETRKHSRCNHTY